MFDCELIIDDALDTPIQLHNTSELKCGHIQINVHTSRVCNQITLELVTQGVV